MLQYSNRTISKDGTIRQSSASGVADDESDVVTRVDFPCQYPMHGEVCWLLLVDDVGDSTTTRVYFVSRKRHGQKLLWS